MYKYEETGYAILPLRGDVWVPTGLYKTKEAAEEAAKIWCPPNSTAVRYRVRWKYVFNWQELPISRALEVDANGNDIYSYEFSSDPWRDYTPRIYQ